MNRPRFSPWILGGLATAACVMLFAAHGFAADAPATAATAAAVPAAAAPPKIDSGDTAWMLCSTALVLMMTIPGLALFYGGMVRKKNILATLMQSFTITCLVTVVWMVAGYSIAFTNGNAYMGDFSRLFLNGIADHISKGPTRPSCSARGPTRRRRRRCPRPST